MPKYTNSLLHLRKQDAIKAALGDKALKRIKDSIQAFMDSDEEIKPEKIDGAMYSIIMIDDVSGENDMIAFYVVKNVKAYYKIAFKEFI